VLKANPDRSNRQIATDVGVSDHTVAEIRAELEACAQIAQLKTTKGKDGRSRPTTPKAKPAAKPKPTHRPRKEPPPRIARQRPIPDDDDPVARASR